MEQLICEHCSMIFKNKTTLKYHTTNSKKCMKLRGIKIESRYQCKGCDEFFVNKVNLSTHMESCKKYCILEVTNEMQKSIDNLKIRENKLLSEIDLITSKNKELNNQKDILEKNQMALLLQQKAQEKTIDDANLQIDKLQKMICDIATKTVDRTTNIIYKSVDEETKENSNIIDEKSANDIQEYKFGNNFIVPIRSDGMINATALCKAAGKRLDHYKENLQTKDYLHELSSVTGIPVSELFNPIIGGKYPGTWVHRKVGYHLAQWISPKFAVQVSLILDELFITGKVELYNEKSADEVDNEYKKQITDLKTKLDTNTQQYQKLLNKHNSSLKTHRYIKFKKTDPCFYIIDSGVDCDCLRYKFGITGLDQDHNIDDRLRCHRTLWPQLKVRYLLFIKDVEMIEKSFKMMFGKEINPNGHEIIEGVTFDEMIERIENLFIKDYHIMTEEKLKEYNDYVETTIKQ